MIEVFRNDFFIARTDSPNGVVEVVRSAVSFRAADDAAQAYVPLLQCLDALGRHRYSLLFDARDSVANNNPDYESWYARYRTELVRDFQRVAILMKTPVGGLQAARLLPPTTGPARVFLDASQAWAFVTEPASARSSRRPQRTDEAPISNSVSPAPGVGRAQPLRVGSRLPPTS